MKVNTKTPVVICKCGLEDNPPHKTPLKKGTSSCLFLLYKNLKEELKLVRADRTGPHRVAFEKNKKRILKTQNVCGICGKPVDMKLKYPHPLSAVIDHVVPVSKGGHPSAIENLQLAHWSCNREKSDKLFNKVQEVFQVLGNRNLPQTRDWTNY